MPTLNSLLAAYLATQRVTEDGRIELTRDDYAEEIVRLCSPSLSFRRYLAVGAEAVLLLVRDPILDCPRVMKVVRPELSEKARKRFLRSAKVIPQNDYFPAVIQLSENPLFVVLSWTSGTDMRDFVSPKNNKYSKTKAIKLFADLLNAVALLHEAEIVHRDIKPENVVVIDEKRIKLIDFGIAKSKNDQNITIVESSLGTRLFAAPEQIADASTADHRADIFSLGRVFYNLMTRQVSFDPAFLSEEEDNFFELAVNPEIVERYQHISQMICDYQKLYFSYLQTGSLRMFAAEPQKADDPEGVEALGNLLFAFKGNISKIQMYTGMSSTCLNDLLSKARELRALK